VRHGYRGAGGRIALTFAFGGGAVRVGVVDTAPAFDPRQALGPDTTLPLEARRPGGLGVHFAEALVDELAYERRGGENHLTLTWRVPPGDAGGTGKADGDR
jgi:anti-sigma regulatory factor (Ser/Thr protein kinase)